MSLAWLGVLLIWWGVTRVAPEPLMWWLLVPFVLEDWYDGRRARR